MTTCQLPYPRKPNVVLMSGQRRRRWTKIKIILGQCLVFALIQIQTNLKLLTLVLHFIGLCIYLFRSFLKKLVLCLRLGLQWLFEIYLLEIYLLEIYQILISMKILCCRFQLSIFIPNYELSCVLVFFNMNTTLVRYVNMLWHLPTHRYIKTTGD